MLFRSAGIAQLKAYSNGKAFYLIRQWVTGKITNQINLLKYYGKYYNRINPEYCQAKDEATNAMAGFIKDLVSHEEENLEEFRSKVFAYEGLSAAKYWDTLGILINTKVPFEKRERKGATDLVNCMLNYGYGILYGKITESLVRAHLNPNLSYLHTPELNRPSLVFDCIEEFRQQVVDRAVFSILMKHTALKCENGLLADATKKIVAVKDRKSVV